MKENLQDNMYQECVSFNRIIKLNIRALSDCLSSLMCIPHAGMNLIDRLKAGISLISLALCLRLMVPSGHPEGVRSLEVSIYVGDLSQTSTRRETLKEVSTQAFSNAKQEAYILAYIQWAGSGKVGRSSVLLYWAGIYLWSFHETHPHLAQRPKSSIKRAALEHVLNPFETLTSISLIFVY